MTHRWRLANALVIGMLACLLGCSGCDPAAPSGPPVPASSDPKGADLVEGAVIVADEYGGGYRVLKMVHVDDYPLPLDYEFHMMAFEPKVDTFEQGAKVWADSKKNGPLKVALGHVFVRKVDFMKRAYRVVGVEPVTAEEKQPYLDSKRGH